MQRAALRDTPAPQWTRQPVRPCAIFSPLLTAKEGVHGGLEGKGPEDAVIGQACREASRGTLVMWQDPCM